MVPFMPSLNIESNRPAKQGSDKAISTHFLSGNDCGSNYGKDCFRILCMARSAFYLKVLEAVLIKLRDPSLCRQKEFVFALQLL